MRVVWDGRALSGSRTGIGWYTHHLLAGFRALQKDISGCLVTNKTIQTDWEQVVIPFPNTVHLRFFWERGLLPLRLKRMDFDVWHSPMTVIPSRIAPRATVATVHDIAFFLYPEIQPPAYRRYWTYWTRVACERADRIIAVSESTRRDLVESFGAEPEKVEVVYEAADPFMFEPPSTQEIEAVREEYRLPSRFLLFVGTLEPRKNLPFLLDLYTEAERRNLDIPPLIVVGGKGWLLSEIEQKLAQFGGKIRWVGYLDRRELRAFYHQSLLVLVPSVYEGFGLQALEAMASGSVVVASNLSSLPEVVGGGGVLLPVKEGPQPWLERILELVENPRLRDELGRQATEQASKFSWNKAAAETYEVYRKALGHT